MGQNKKRKQEAELEKKRQALELQKQEHMKQQQIKKAMTAKQDEMNETYTIDGNNRRDGSDNQEENMDPDSTYTVPSSKTSDETPDSYEMTPTRYELPPEELIDKDNYNIDDLRSDEDTDDDECPRKKIPLWATGREQKKALLAQHYNPPDVNLIFEVQEATPNLEEIFGSSKRNYTKRTSSMNWGHQPPTSHDFC